MTTSIIWHNQDKSVSPELHKQILILTSPSPRLETLQTQLQTVSRCQPARMRLFSPCSQWGWYSRRLPPKDQRLTLHFIFGPVSFNCSHCGKKTWQRVSRWKISKLPWEESHNIKFYFMLPRFISRVQLNELMK